MTGTWAVEAGEYSQSNVAAAEHHAVAGRLAWRNYGFQSKLRCTASITPPGNPGIMVRYTDVNNFYHLRLRCTLNEVQLYSSVGGVLTPLRVRPWRMPLLGEYWTLRMEVEGPMIRCYMDDILVFEVIDTNLGAGMIGYRSHTGYHYFDDALVYEI